MNQVLVSLLVTIARASSTPFNAHLVFLLTDDVHSAFGLRTVAPALQLAAARLRSDTITVTSTTVNLSSVCSSSFGPVLSAEQYYRYNATAFFGPGCGAALDPVARMTGFWNVPHFTAAGFSDHFGQKRTLFKTLTRLAFSVERMADFLLTILVEHNWHHVALLVNGNSTLDRETGISIEKVLKRSQSVENVGKTRHSVVLNRFEFNGGEAASLRRRAIKAALMEGRRVARGILFMSGVNATEK